MSPHRITATSAFWPAPSPASEDWATAARDTPGGFRARPLPISTGIPLDSLGASPAEHVSVWLRKHGRAIKPKLTAEQVLQTQQCFRLMDADGSGAIDSGELGNAFKLLGIKASQKGIKKMLADAGADESGEVGYDAFVRIMTTQLRSPDPNTGPKRTASGGVQGLGPILSFDITVNEYRRSRKKIITALHERDSELLSMLSAPPGSGEAQSEKPALPKPASTCGPAIGRPVSASSAYVETCLKEHTALMSGITAYKARYYTANRPGRAAVSSTSKQPADVLCKHQLPRRPLPTQGCHEPQHSAKQHCWQHQQDTRVCRLGAQPDAHLAALKAQGELESVLGRCVSPKHLHGFLSAHKAGRAGTSFAAVQRNRPGSQPDKDLFGAAVVDSTQGTGMGLVMMRSPSSLW